MAILKSYKNLKMHFFGDGEWEQPVELTLEQSYLFGLIKREVTTVYTINMFSSLKEHYEHWDELIKNKTKLKV